MSGETERSGRPSLLASTVKTAAIVAGIALVATSWLSGASIEQRDPARLVAGRVLDDPQTTGAIGRSANATRLDPCAAPRRP